MMTKSDEMDEQKLRELAKSLGYKLSRLREAEKNRPQVLELDLRDVSEILFS